jgi:hypothetical protein
MSLSGIALTALLALALSCALVACQNVATNTLSTAVRVIDASYMAPAINVSLDGNLFAANIGQATFTNYGILAARTGSLVSVMPTTGGTALISGNFSFLAGQQHSLLITDNGVTPAEYSINLLDDQRTAPAQGQSAFRFINQAIKTGAVDIYLVPKGVELKNVVPILTKLSASAVSAYIGVSSQTVNIVVTRAGNTTPLCTSADLNLTGGEVRTVLLMNAQLTTDPPVTIFIGSDVN